MSKEQRYDMGKKLFKFYSSVNKEDCNENVKLPKRICEKNCDLKIVNGTNYICVTSLKDRAKPKGHGLFDLFWTSPWGKYHNCKQ